MTNFSFAEEGFLRKLTEMNCYIFLHTNISASSLMKDKFIKESVLSQKADVDLQLHKLGVYLGKFLEFCTF